ncbi:calcium-activated chloride channel regulator 2 [Nephila pilipes]|uniref:Calcium-activated chloride channel regulator 2 n=1 Tax=Nephila pilipes TaxID=299642 RepID=A0A8X6TQY1_NEPPI|nr:calcium-activated chloride channel regulator 2 [Nephila pilipes]
MEKALWLSVFVLYTLYPVSTSKLKIVNNGYEGILIALDPGTLPQDRIRIVTYLQNLLQSSSSILTTSTKGRAYFRSATFLVPRSWGDIKNWLTDADNKTSFEDSGGTLNREDADVIVTTSRTNDHPYTLHQGGCGRRGLRIYLPSSSLMGSGPKLSGRDFIRLWSEFRYGTFPEGGFAEDEKYPTVYRMPDEATDRATECKTEPKRPQDDCDENATCEKECKEECQTECEIKCKERCKGKCKSEPIVSSLMDQNLPNEAILFCEGRLSLGPNHNPNSPSKHNLLCNEEGTWFTVLRSPDFKYGKNAAPKSFSDISLAFRFVKEVDAPKVIVAIDVSSQMKKKDMYTLVKNAFSHFVTTILPSGTELSLVTFGGDSNSSLVTSSLVLTDDTSRLSYLEGQPLPEEPLDEENSCLDCALEDIIKLVENENSSFTSAPHVIMLTTTQHLDPDKYDAILLALQQSEMRLMALVFQKDSPTRSTLNDLCSESGNRLIYVGRDPLKDMYRSFVQAVRGHHSVQMISQEYLITLDEENIEFKFILDKSVSKDLKVSLSGPQFSSSPLEYGNTRLIGPQGSVMFLRKREIVPSWDFHLPNPQTGTYTLKTRRKLGAKSPVMVSVYGTAPIREEPITTHVWVEILESTISPPPVQIFAEVRKGNNPIKNATVIAHVYHPRSEEISEIPLFDDGLGNVDITQDDGVYSHYFTNFTTTGFYNVHVMVSGGLNDYSTVLRGPSSTCCGSVFTSDAQSPSGQFLREAGPATFEVTTLSDQEDAYPPAKVTDLRITKRYDQVLAVQWTAVGDDFDTGVASTYELKVLRNRSLIRNRFSHPGLELSSVTIGTTPLAEYGMTLHHLLEIPSLERGMYYLGIRAVDEAGNAGEPSNAVAFWVEGKQPAMHCTNEQIMAERLTQAASHARLSFVVLFIALFIIL